MLQLEKYFSLLLRLKQALDSYITVRQIKAWHGVLQGKIYCGCLTNSKYCLTVSSVVAQDPSGGKTDNDQMSESNEDVLSSELLADTDYDSLQGSTGSSLHFTDKDRKNTEVQMRNINCEHY